MIREELLALADEIDANAESIAGYMDSCEGNFSKSDADEYYKFARWANRIREAVERDGEGATTVSAYDLLSEDERKAIAWVRERGGLGAVEKRLMPEGMEWLLDVWPKWSNGEYCKFGDWWKAGEYGEREPQQLSRLTFFTPEKLREWGQDEGENFGYAWDCMRPSDTTYRPDKVEPPAPKVLDADGVEIRVGDTVWDIETGIEFEVTGIASEFEIRVKDESMKIGVWTTPCGFTHAKPVLDADGVPCREGDEVWEVRSHRRREIVGTNYCDHRTGEPLILCDGDNAIPIPATCVTHTKPEPPDSRQAVVNEIGDEMAARIDLLVSSGRWSDAD